jgi:hypothetical protein
MTTQYLKIATRARMIPTHKNELITKLISIPAMGMRGTMELDFSVRVILLNSTEVFMFMVSISSLPGFVAKLRPQKSYLARTVPDARIRNAQPVINRILSPEYLERRK